MGKLTYKERDELVAAAKLQKENKRTAHLIRKYGTTDKNEIDRLRKECDKGHISLKKPEKKEEITAEG